MTMHLLRGASSLNTRKPQTKFTKAKLQELELAWRKHNKNMKQKGYHDLCYKAFEDYLDYTLGKIKVSKDFKPYEPKPTYRRETQHYPSASIAPSDAVSGQNSTARKENQKYTGTLVKGIATMHKSNAIPVIDEEQARDLARMRR